MTKKMSEERIDKTFLEYTEPFKKEGDMIILKINHTKRVADLCKQLATNLNLSKEDIELAYLCGTLHDIGRFEQYKKYKSYNDRDTIDHGDLGEEILKNKKVLRKFNEDETLDELLLTVVKYHNKMDYPQILDKKTDLMLKITRDADKIDILNTYISEIKHLKIEDSALSDTMYNNLFKHQLLSLKDKKTKADSVAIPIAFLYDFNYKESVEIVRDKKYIETFIDNHIEFTNNNKLKEQLKSIKIDIEEYYKNLS